ncbi:MAG TPA: hypothetical protein VIT65_02990 [Microlunatus sp.]
MTAPSSDLYTGPVSVMLAKTGEIRLHPAQESPTVGGRAPLSGPHPPGWSR